MALHILAEIAGGSVIVAVALIGLVVAIMIVAMIRYDVDGVVKIWGLLGTLVGLIVGTMGTYFFTREEVRSKDSVVAATKAALVATQSEKAQQGAEIQRLATGLNWSSIDPKDKEAIAKISALGGSLQQGEYLAINASPTPSP
jgi:hypothetical protein